MKKYIFKLCNLIGLNAFFRFLNRKKIRILMYHGFFSAPLPLYSWTSIDAKDFYWQMKYLARKYNVVRLEDIFLSGINPSSEKLKHLTAITFDDGLKSVMEVAEGILDRFDFPATCFVIPELASNNDHVWTDILYEIILSLPPGPLDLTYLKEKPLFLDRNIEKRGIALDLLKKYLKAAPDEIRRKFILRLTKLIHSDGIKTQRAFDLMSRDDIINLAKRNRISIAAHTFSHPILSKNSFKNQEMEIRKSIQELKLWGLPAEIFFAYPNGEREDFDESTISILKNNNIQFAFTSQEDFYTPAIYSKFKIPRMNIGADTGKDEFKAKMSGLYVFLNSLYLRLKRSKSWIKEILLRNRITMLAR